MRRSLEYCKIHDLVISTHSEDLAIANNGAMREGEFSTRLGFPGWPSLAESIMVGEQQDEDRLDIEGDSDDGSLNTTINLYSDFNYWQIWAMGSWFLGNHFSLDVMASYEPESHTEQSDDSALGFASLRLTWRP